MYKMKARYEKLKQDIEDTLERENMEYIRDYMDVFEMDKLVKPHGKEDKFE